MVYRWCSVWSFSSSSFFRCFVVVPPSSAVIGIRYTVCCIVLDLYHSHIEQFFRSSFRSGCNIKYLHKNFVHKTIQIHLILYPTYFHISYSNTFSFCFFTFFHFSVLRFRSVFDVKGKVLCWFFVCSL